MRRALIILIAGAAQEVISGPAVPYEEQKRRFKELKGDHPEGVERAELWESSRGLTKRISFKDYVAGEDPLDIFSEAADDLTTDEREVVELFRASKLSIEDVRVLMTFDLANMSEVKVSQILAKEEQPSVPGATDASGQSAPPTPEEVVETEAQIIDGAVALVEVPPANAPGIGTTTGPVLEGQSAEEDDGPTLDLPPAAQPEVAKQEAEKPTPKSQSSKSKKH